MFWCLNLMNELGVTASLWVREIYDCVPQIQCWNALHDNPVSSDMMSAAVLLWDTSVCFLQVHEIGTNVCDPNIHITPPSV